MIQSLPIRNDRLIDASYFIESDSAVIEDGDAVRLEPERLLKADNRLLESAHPLQRGGQAIHRFIRCSLDAQSLRETFRSVGWPRRFQQRIPLLYVCRVSAGIKSGRLLIAGKRAIEKAACLQDAPKIQIVIRAFWACLQRAPHKRDCQPAISSLMSCQPRKMECVTMRGIILENF